ncbi:hypothetical protein TRVA0_033S00562 [Trichomonascus vanleenenianus]|uniref:uncharacterized protein n=1 Tax=Trichomonascus vanleenenianus TaxID=2268995 RepID=UPI003EC96D70
MNLEGTDCHGQIATVGGEEILSTTEDTEVATKLNKLTTAFVETDTLAYSLKLGSIRKIVTCSRASGSEEEYTVQSKTENQSGALLSTVVGPSLQKTLVADGVMKETTLQIL